MRFPRVYTDEQGETHVGVRDLPEHEARLGPPPNPLGHITDDEVVSSFVTFSAPAGTEVPSHNASQPYICIVLSGEGEVTASDGTTERLGPGGLIYCDDVSGKGHVTRSITDLHVAFINRPAREKSIKTHTGKVLVDNTHGLKFTESPRWHDGKLWFLDIHDKRIKTANLDGRVETAVELGFIPNAFGFRRDGSIIVGDAMQRKIYRWDGKALQPLADLSAITVFCLSDGIVDAQDRLYVGDIGYNFFDPGQKPVDTCVIACVEPDGHARVVAKGLSFPNGIVVTPDGKTLIVAETMGHRLTAFDVQSDGSLSNRRVYAQLPGDVNPDGIALDAEGAVWLANPDGKPAVLRVRAGGEIVEQVELDTHGYAVMLGGPKRRHLFISGSDSHDPAEIARTPSATLRVVEVDVAGSGAP